MMVALGGCRNDGRTMRPATADQDSSISDPPTTTDASAFIDAAGDPSDAAPPTVTLPATTAALVVSAPWRNGAAIDPRFTCDGPNVSPALSWSAAPAGTVEIAITLTDLDAPAFAHWVIAGISAQSIALDEATVPLGAYEATNGNGDLGYTGPCPPAGAPHEYLLTVHYLGALTGLGDGTAAAEMITAIESVEIGSAGLSGSFSRT